MNKYEYHSMMRGARRLDYEIYLNTERLLACQKSLKSFAIQTNCNS